jgi:hypothetical protein
MIEDIPRLLDKMTLNEQQELYELLELYKKEDKESRAVLNFMDFVDLIWPHFVNDTFVSGRHHRLLPRSLRI